MTFVKRLSASSLQTLSYLRRNNAIDPAEADQLELRLRKTLDGRGPLHVFAVMRVTHLLADFIETDAYKEAR